MLRQPYIDYLSQLRVIATWDLPHVTPSLLRPTIPSVGSPSPSSSLLQLLWWYWNINQFLPSDTPLGLSLGPDLPRADEPSSGILRLSTDRILTYLLATHTGILTSNRSTSPSGLASPLLERSPTI